MRKKLVQKLSSAWDNFIVYSIPLEVCKNARAARTKICKEQQYAFPDFGFCAAQEVVDMRLLFSDSLLADLYNPLTMPAALTKAHQEPDQAVDLAY